MGEFKLELQFENAQFRSQSALFLSHVTLKFDGWSWKTIGHLSYTASSFVYHFIANVELRGGGWLNWSYSPETPNLGQIQQFF